MKPHFLCHTSSHFGVPSLHTFSHLSHLLQRRRRLAGSCCRLRSLTAPHSSLSHIITLLMPVTHTSVMFHTSCRGGEGWLGAAAP
jgi:hypothetical protein